MNEARVTPADIEAEIASEHFFTAWDGLSGAIEAGKAKVPPASVTTFEAMRKLTFCVLVLRNGFTVTGESACVCSENFDAEIGRNGARANAIEKCWPLLGFRLRDQVASGN